jgi:DNA adenine methylase
MKPLALRPRQTLFVKNTADSLDRLDVGSVKPFLRWPGGKRWTSTPLAELARRHLSTEGTYYEPFLGGGAVFFSLRPPRAVLADINSELIDTYRIVRSRPRQLMSRLKAMRVNRAVYEEVRAARPNKQFDRALRLLYLNRTAFSGLYRLTQRGIFNVPYGGGDRTPCLLWEKPILIQAAMALRKATLLAGDFESHVMLAGKGDVVYCDPTYTVAHDNNGFLRYNERVFAWKDQVRLEEVGRKAASRGATVIVTNAHHPSLKKLYSKWPSLVLSRHTSISPRACGRRRVLEYCFVLAK